MNHESDRPQKPPPILLGSRVLEYAVLDDHVMYSGRSYLFVDGKELGPVPRLAIGQTTAGEVLLLHCGEEWQTLGIASYATVARAKKRAEDIYPGVSACWIAEQNAEADGADQLDGMGTDQHCSFCGKRADQVTQMIEGSNTQTPGTARICDSCVTECYEMLQSE